jgi:hypothetical protein
LIVSLFDNKKKTIILSKFKRESEKHTIYNNKYRLEII